MRVVLLLITFLTLWTPVFAQKPKLFVFLPSNVRAQAMQLVFNELCPEIEVVVYGRITEFQNEIERQSPDGILTLPLLIEESGNYRQLAANGKYNIELQGVNENKSSEVYGLLSIKGSVDPKKISEISVGAMNILGTPNMASFVSNLLGEKAARVRSAAKIEDLLTLLQLDAVDAILVPKSKISFFEERSKLKFDVHFTVKKEVGLPVIAMLNDQSVGSQLILKNVKNLDLTRTEFLGVDAWVEK